VIRSVLLVTQYYPPERGAAQVRLGAIVRELRRRDLDVEVLTALPNYPTGRIFPGWRQRLLQYRDEDGVRVGRVWVYAAMGSGPARMANYLSFGLTSVLGVLRSRRADWTVVEYPTLFGALPAVALSRLRRRRVALLVADLWVDSIVEVGAAVDGKDEGFTVFVAEDLSCGQNGGDRSACQVEIGSGDGQATLTDISGF